jgi:hypothetical protein
MTTKQVPTILLKQIHTYLDMINGRYGSRDELCLYCHTNIIGIVGICHTKYCVITQLRDILYGEILY